MKTIERQESGEQEQLVLLSWTQSRIERQRERRGLISLSRGCGLCLTLARSIRSHTHIHSRGRGLELISRLVWKGKREGFITQIRKVMEESTSHAAAIYPRSQPVGQFDFTLHGDGKELRRREMRGRGECDCILWPPLDRSLLSV